MMRNRIKSIAVLFPVLTSVMLTMGCSVNAAGGNGVNNAGSAAASVPVASQSGETGSSAPDPASTAAAPSDAGAENNMNAKSMGGGADNMAKLLYQGHASFRITNAEGKVIFVDPYAGEGYDLPADLILVTHEHSDHNNLSLIQSRNPDCAVITEKEALKDGTHQTIDLGYVTVEATEAGNKNHDPSQCVGYILTISGGIQIYATGDTSKTTQMETLAQRHLDYALICCDGIYNMDVKEASECAALIAAQHSIPYHMAPGKLFSQEVADQFQVDGRLILTPGEEITLEKQ